MSERLEDRAIALLDKLEELAEQGAAPAWELARAAVQADAIINLVLTGVLVLVTRGLYVKVLPWARRRDKEDCLGDAPSRVFWVVLLLIVAIATSIQAVILAPYLAAFAPDLALAMRVIGDTESVFPR